MDIKIAGLVIVLILGNVGLGSCDDDSECGAACKMAKTSAAVAGGVATTAAGNALINAAGVAKYSMAAAVHSAIGNVAAGSTFAALQSVGALGGMALLGPVTAAGGGALAIFFLR